MAARLAAVRSSLPGRPGSGHRAVLVRASLDREVPRLHPSAVRAAARPGASCCAASASRRGPSGIVRRRPRQPRPEIARSRRKDATSAQTSRSVRAPPLPTLLSGRGTAVPDADALRLAWTRVVASDGFEAMHEVVDLAGRLWWHPRSRGATSEAAKGLGRKQDSVPLSGKHPRPDAGVGSSAHTNWDVWLGGAGRRVVGTDARDVGL